MPDTESQASIISMQLRGHVIHRSNLQGKPIRHWLLCPGSRELPVMEPMNHRVTHMTPHCITKYQYFAVAECWMKLKWVQIQGLTFQHWTEIFCGTQEYFPHNFGRKLWINASRWKIMSNFSQHLNTKLVCTQQVIWRSFQPAGETVEQWSCCIN